MMRFPYETTIQRGDAEIAIKGVYDVSPYVPAQLYGDYPHPAEGGEVEIVTAHRVDGEPLNLTDAEEVALIEEMARRSGADMAEEAAAAAEWKAQCRRDDLLMGDD